MAFFFGLLSFSVVFYLIQIILKKNKSFWIASRNSTSVMFILIGLMHILKPEKLTYMIEGILPFEEVLVIISGIFEIVLGIGLFIPRTRVLSGWLLIVLLIVMFPANINVAFAQLPPPGGLPASPWYLWSRLLFQPVYIYWVWRSAVKNTTPPGYKKSSPTIQG